jgi:hypothetical protein
VCDPTNPAPPVMSTRFAFNCLFSPGTINSSPQLIAN